MNNLLKKTLTYLRKFIVFLEKKANSKRQENNSSIHNLAPKILIDSEDLSRIEPYLKNLKDAIETDDINNIALTGNYGSGKSTIIKTFQYLNPQYKYLNISLVAFKEDKDNPNSEAFEKRLEVSVLQQMFYHVEPSVIPDSRFKRIINLTTRELWFKAGFLIFWIFSGFILFRFEKLERLNPEEWSVNYQFDWFAVSSAIIFFIGVGLFLKIGFRLFSNSKINKVNIKGELELGEAIDKSVFNQHLEEILYFFERTNYDVVVIEDIDRFESIDIFTKLREINTLVNNSNLIKRRIKFIYAVRDEIFKDKNERVKFFEFIIPIIPFINPSNANEQLEKLIEAANLDGVLSSDFTSDVVTFIDDIDMRLLINIFHEFLIYRQSLKSKNLDPDKLFAIIVYKNMFPDDFGNLAKRKGNLYSFFFRRNVYAQVLIDEINSEVTAIDHQITLLESEIEKPIEELRSPYILRLISKWNKFAFFHLNGGNVSVVQALTDEFFAQIKSSSNIYYMQHTYNELRSAASGITFSSIEKEVSDLTYDQREKLLRDKSNNQINKLKVERKRIVNRISEVEGLSIMEIFERLDIQEHLDGFSENYLMRNLLLNGYIDEHYDDYISLFHEISLTKEDFSFERKVKSGINSDFTYTITKAENLLKRIPDKYFKREAIMNYDLIECLLKNKNKYKSKYEMFFTGLSIDGERQFKFIVGFTKTVPNEIGPFIKDLCIYKPTLWQYLNDKSGLPEEEIRRLLSLVFEFADEDSIIKFDEIEALIEHLSSMPDFLVFGSGLRQVHKIKNFIRSKNVVFKSLDKPDGSDNNLFEFIYKNNFYKINEQNIAVILGHYQNDNLKGLRSAHYSKILNSGLSNLLSYISDNLSEYVENVMLNIEENVLEDEATVIAILNREDIKAKVKVKLMMKQITKITSVTDITDTDVWPDLFIHNKVKPRWTNVQSYIDDIDADDLDETLITFLNIKENYLDLAKVKLNNSNTNDNGLKKIAFIIIHCSGLSIDAFSALLNSFTYIFTKLRYDQLTTERIEMMLSKKRLALTIENYEGLKETEESLHIRLIENFQGSFVADFTKFSSEFDIDAYDLNFIFTSEKITLKNKLSIIKAIDDEIIIQNSSIADTVCSMLSTEYIPLRFEVLDAMFKAHPSSQNRITLLNLHLEHLEDYQVKSLVEQLGKRYAKLFKKQHKPVFTNNSYNFGLFQKLQERGLIIRFEPLYEKNQLKVIANY